MPVLRVNLGASVTVRGSRLNRLEGGLYPMSGYDTRCYDLALYFLPNATPERISELAQVIQDAIEDELRDPR